MSKDNLLSDDPIIARPVGEESAEAVAELDTTVAK